MVIQAETVRGKERIQQLTEMFPEMPRQKVVMADLMIRGCRHSAGLEHAGRWALPDGHDHYDYDYEERDEDLTEGVSNVPKYIYMKGANFFLMQDSKSPYEVKYEGGGRYMLYRDGEPVEEVYFAPCPEWFWKKTSSGMPMSSLAFTRQDEQSFGYYPTTYCEYFRDGKQCRFCNLNPTGDRFSQLREDWGVVRREQDIYETTVAFAQEMGVSTIGLKGGSFYNRRKEAEMYIRHFELIKRALKDCGVTYKGMTLTNQAMEVEDHARLKEVGVTSVSWHQEVWDPRLFEIICPGKATVGREHWMELLYAAVDTWGWGKVGNSFVIGAQTSPPYGDMTEEQEFESVSEGIRTMATHGVSTFICSLRGNPGSLLSNAQRPRIEHYLGMERECIKLQQEYKVGRG